VSFNRTDISKPNPELPPYVFEENEALGFVKKGRRSDRKNGDAFQKKRRRLEDNPLPNNGYKTNEALQKPYGNYPPAPRGFGDF